MRWLMWFGCLLFGHRPMFRITNSRGDWIECGLCGARQKLEEQE